MVPLLRMLKRRNKRAFVRRKALFRQQSPLLLSVREKAEAAKSLSEIRLIQGE